MYHLSISLVISVLICHGAQGGFIGLDEPFQFDASSEEVPYKREGEGPNKDLDSNGKYVGDFNSDCSESIFVTPTRKTAEIEPEEEFLSAQETKCHWNVIGTETCNPVITCNKFKLATTSGDEKCKDEYLEITDGGGGYDKYCGTDGPKEITTRNKLRDLYITYKSGSKSQKRQLKCEVTCSLRRDESNPPQGLAIFGGLYDGWLHLGEGKPLPETFQPTLNDNCNCGRKPNADRIVGGVDAKRGEFPWMAGLVTANTRKPFCGGTIINNRFILTAAHCFKGPYMKKDNLQILLNGHFLDLTSAAVASGQGGSQQNIANQVAAQDKAQNAVRFSVEKYFIHPLYVRQTNDYDVALLKTTEPIDFVEHNFLAPACMPNIGSYEKTYEGAKAVVAGWGLNSSNAAVTMGTLQKLDVSVFTLPECKSFFDERLTRRMMCAGYKEGGKDSCKGDSGGPLISEKKKQIWEIIGAVSWGEGCAAGNSPGVYLRISEVEQWVRYMSNNEDATWCSE